MNIPLSELRTRFTELARDRAIEVYCGVGQRGYYAVRFLRQNGFEARNLSGGVATYRMRSAAGVQADVVQAAAAGGEREARRTTQI
jgi:rhodanese-related sulfurtransferase